MKNAETPVVKLVLYGAMSSLGSALMAESLRRQHEVIAILDDLTALAPRPGLRAKGGDLFDPDRVKQSVAGSSAVICLLDAPDLPGSTTPGQAPDPVNQVRAVDALIEGMQGAGIRRLMLVGEFSVLDNPPSSTSLPHHAAQEILDALRSSALDWTLINAPRGVAGLGIEHFNQVGDSLEPGLAEPLRRLNGVAIGISDELRLNLHLREHVSFIATQPQAAT
ncbi:NADH-flavin reductase [Pseudomonas protegens]|jgi:putative NADH-flavin reductase|uniref:NADH-flavin reductase n=1 Tax=Pseudomonas protegens TaxID=380021 RepID=A0ABY2VC14_9PSED|nr:MULTISPECIES: NAD(P)H-binding protein [Pseudomonas]ASE20407.1 NADH-flavin reductase [Pseudomonas protegens]MBB1615728.1 NADH-flavin reductase [Pseudomonas sp. UMC65]MBB1620531.1 NADH-flavin reductase [Pseudomonas sp. UME65]MBF0641730.1 NAD(P)H-binding protein [Pseudomonas protegens]MBP5123209.1 NAD(P)H-binding protein [Pseudomonas protegens]